MSLKLDSMLWFAEVRHVCIMACGYRPKQPGAMTPWPLKSRIIYSDRLQNAFLIQRQKKSISINAENLSRLLIKIQLTNMSFHNIEIITLSASEALKVDYSLFSEVAHSVAGASGLNSQAWGNRVEEPETTQWFLGMCVLRHHITHLIDSWHRVGLG